MKAGTWLFWLFRMGEKARLMWKRIRSVLGRRGFTVIEVLVVTAIVSLLSAIALLQFKNYQEKSANTVAVQDLRNVKSLAEAFYADYQQYP
jgi:prepilin-type N-terminal cleavage/methylation domain-containing protein